MASTRLQKPMLIVGSVNVDLSFYVETFPSPGETTSATGFKKAYGGKGANQAAMSAILNGSAIMIAKVGEDAHGKECVENLSSFGVDVEGVLKTSSAPTGTAAIQVDSAGENLIIVVGGANDELSADDVSTLGSAFDSSQALICQLEVPVPTVLKAMEIAQSKGKVIYFNPSPCPRAVESILPLLSIADVVIPNQGELGLLTSLPTSTQEECTTAARALLTSNSNLKAVIATLGSSGSLYITASDSIHSPPTKLSGPVIDTVGAGDCFLASVAYELECGSTAEEAMGRANLLASKSIQKEGAMSSYDSFR